ncbi:MAG: AAA family ATPase [Bacteroidetes bacterium]|nr:AAA family ATPase [Bacteroidota bacterium]
MIKKLIIENFRCYKKTEIHFKDLTIIVGKNNAGKSTLIEALRILSIVVNRCKYIAYTQPPSWVKQDETVLGIIPSIANLNITSANIFHMYGDAPAKIIAEFGCGSRIHIFIGEDAEIFATIFNTNGLAVESKSFAAALNLDEINILPQIVPIQRNETFIDFKTVQRNLNTNLSSRNFRNQINYYKNDFPKFKELAERSWPGLYIHEDNFNRSQGELFLYIKEGGFECEIGFSGHGLQMWLQTIWFISRSSQNATIILDEPDVYMHADLQRRLIKLIKKDFKQILIATHSVEIMSEVEPENILPINSAKAKQQYANKLPMVQKILNEIGSIHNIEIARIFSHKKFLIVEGEKDDIKLLDIFQSILFPESLESFETLPKSFVEGWGGWQKVLGSTKVFKDNKATITTYCIFDSDYHLEDEKNSRKEEALKEELNLHIWQRKEIENYIIIPTAIVRLIKKKKPNAEISIKDVSDQIDQICESCKEETIEAFATEYQSRLKQQLTPALRNARQYVNDRWNYNKQHLVSGKKIVSSICTWSLDIYKANINKFSIAREIMASEICNEMKEVISAIEMEQEFPRSA